jgi:hypothetical protein
MHSNLGHKTVLNVIYATILLNLDETWSNVSYLRFKLGHVCLKSRSPGKVLTICFLELR